MAGVIAGCSSEKSHTNKVNIDKVEIVAPNVQGAGWDLTARAMQKTLTEEKIFTKPITVTNKVGGSGDVGWKYTKQKGGHVLAINSSLLITNNLLGHSKLTYKDFTPLATLASDWEVVVVSKRIKHRKRKRTNGTTKTRQEKFQNRRCTWPRKRRSPILRTSKQSLRHKPCRTTILRLRKQRKKS